MTEIISLYGLVCFLIAFNAHTEHIDGFLDKLLGRLFIAAVWPYVVFLMINVPPAPVKE